jgi:hypothetical protein
MPESEKPTKAPTKRTKVVESTESIAVRMLERAQALRQKTEATKAREESERYQYFYMCRKCNGHGIYFARQPFNQELFDDDWFATYKDLDEPYTERDILCQECLERGKEIVLAVQRPNRRFIAKERAAKHPFYVSGRSRGWLCKFPLDPEEYKLTPVLKAKPDGSTFNNTAEINYAPRKTHEVTR